MRQVFALLLLAACAACFANCSGGDGTVSNASNRNAANANGNAAGAREGTGPGGTGIGGTSEGNRNATVAGNSNVEPAGVNRNVGATPAASNRNR
jgi:hypothetical protein